jgi:hypothetical protein
MRFNSSLERFERIGGKEEHLGAFLEERRVHKVEGTCYLREEGA